MTLKFHLVNVFAERPLSGNALCVFESTDSLSDADMQALALQFNLSETTFVLPSQVATARVRIFTPSFEMPFAGHPTLGTAHVVRALYHCGDALTLEMLAGVIPVTAEGDVWTLEASSRAQGERVSDGSCDELAAMLGIAPSDVAPGSSWVNTGSEQLLIPLSSAEAVERCRPDPKLLAKHGSSATREGMAYVWARTPEDDVVARFFFLKRGVLVEDPGTGSACANLGAWLLAHGAPLPIRLTVRQGAATGRPCVLRLAVDVDRRIFVTGRVVHLGSGEILPLR